MTKECLTPNEYWKNPDFAIDLNPGERIRIIKEATAMWFSQLALILPECEEERHKLRWSITWLNRPLAFGWARKFMGCPVYQEILDEAISALWRATKGFDVSRGIQFSTYATWAITRSAGRVHKQWKHRNHPVDIGPHVSFLGRRDEEPDDQAAVKEVVNKAMQSLEEKDAEIVRRRFGLHGRKPESLRIIGDSMGVTKERIRQRQLRAMAKIRPMLESLK